MSGRDPDEEGRAATPLELLFDLTFVIAFGISASQLAHMLAEDHVGAGLAGFAFSTFAVCWAWINFSWFASAYDTDDWVYRLTTMLQMVGVIILALGIPPLFTSIEHGEHVDNRVLVAGYVVMRIAMVFQWLRAARQDPERRKACLTYAVWISVAQVGWIGVLLADTSLEVTFVLVGLMTLIEMIGPRLGEKVRGGTPWHTHHIVERYGLLVIIALGEGVVGTVASIAAVVNEQGWSTDAILVALAGTGLTFGMWWVYFVVPAAEALHEQRERSFLFGYGHILIFGAIVATGAGLHAAAYFIEDHSKLGSVETVASVAIPVGIYLLLIFALYAMLVRALDPFHLVLAIVSLGVLVGSVGLAAAGVDMAVCLLVVMAAPVVAVVGFEFMGHRHGQDDIDRIIGGG
ncbi:MAG: low temperature requirement protein A [Mycobacterium sp.]